LQGWFPSNYIEIISGEERFPHLLEIVLNGSEEAREHARLALWQLVFESEERQFEVDSMVAVMSGHDEDVVMAVLEGLRDWVEGSEENQLVWVEEFDIGLVLGLLVHGSAGVQAKACFAIAALTCDCKSNCDAFVQDGIAQPLVGLLGSGDAEVKESAIIAVCMVIDEDHPNNSSRKDAFCSAGAAAAICQLLQSPIEDVQEHAVTAICLFCDSHLRSKNEFRDAGCVPLLVGLLSSPSENMQISCCHTILKLSEAHNVNIVALCDAGAVGALVGVVLKGSGEALTQASLAAWGLVLGGGGDQAGVDALDNALGGDAEAIVQAGLESLAAGVHWSEEKQRAYVERFGVGRVVGLLGHGSAGVQAKACTAILNLALNCASNRVAFREGGVVSLLVGLLGSGNGDVQNESLRAIWSVAVNSSENKDAFCSAGAATTICKLLQSSNPVILSNAAGCIYVLCWHHSRSQDAFRDAGCVPLLTNLLSSPSVDVHNWSNKALQSLRHYAENSSNPSTDPPAKSTTADVHNWSNKALQSLRHYSENSSHRGTDPPAKSITTATAAPHSDLTQPLVTSTPVVNFASEWLDEDGCVRPKGVNFSLQCPKGHILASLGGSTGGDSTCRNWICRICHASIVHPFDESARWLICSCIASCCGWYSVCCNCAHGPTGDPKFVVSDEFCTLVTYYLLNDEMQLLFCCCLTRARFYLL
jgi:hypothetical protein